MHNWSIANLYREKRKQHGPHPILRMSVNGASTIRGSVSMGITQWFDRCYA